MTAQDMMCKNVLYVSYNDSMIRTASILKENNIGFLPVVKEGKVIGVITDRDLCIHGITEENNFHNPVENIITKQIITVKKEDSFKQICEIMARYRIKRVLVAEEKKIIGIISISDLLQYTENKEDLFKLLQSIFHIDQETSMEEPKVDEFYL